jgi:cytochrome b561
MPQMDGPATGDDARGPPCPTGGHFRPSDAALAVDNVILTREAVGMTMRNGKTHWGRISRGLHWGMALMILIEAPTGFVMGRTYAAKDPVMQNWHYWTANIHHSLGLVLLVLALSRGLWRLTGPVPEAIGTNIERHAARVTHAMLYALLLLVPLSGWAALSSLQPTAQFPNPLWFFGRDGFGLDGWVPHIVPPVAWDAPTPWRYGTFISAHCWMLVAGAVLLFIRVAAALRHHLLLRDAILRRMIKGSS